MVKDRMLTTAAATATAALIATGALADPLADIEAANEQLVRDFFAAASTDLDHVRTFLAEDAVFQYEDTRLDSRDAYIARAEPKMAGVESYAAEPVRTVVVGNTVLNERVDIATLSDGQEIRLPVVSVFLVADGKIAEWREFPPAVAGDRATPSLTEVEAANERLVRDFFAISADVDYDNPDPTYLYDYLTEDFAYQYEDLRIEGLETFIAQQAPNMSSVASAESDVRRIFAIGNIVLNERLDVARLKDGQERRWTVSGVMRIADGKIAEWRDYPLPETAAPTPAQ